MISARDRPQRVVGIARCEHRLLDEGSVDGRRELGIFGSPDCQNRARDSAEHWSRFVGPREAGALPAPVGERLPCRHIRWQPCRPCVAAPELLDRDSIVIDDGLLIAIEELAIPRDVGRRGALPPQAVGVRHQDGLPAGRRRCGRQDEECDPGIAGHGNRGNPGAFAQPEHADAASVDVGQGWAMVRYR